MSRVISIDTFFDELAVWGDALLVTVTDESTARMVTVRPEIATIDGRRHVRISRPGRTAMANAAERPAVSLYFAAHEGSKRFSLIVDGTATPVNDTLLIAPQHAVLHRPAR